MTMDPDLPWTIEADMYSVARNIPLEAAADLVMIRYFKVGDTRPLAWWLQGGHLPSPATLRYIGFALEPGKLPTDKFPYQLFAKSRSPKRGRPPKGPEQNLRDWLIYRNVAKRMEELGEGSYEAAIQETAGMDGLNEHAVKRAYDTMKKVVEASRTAN